MPASCLVCAVSSVILFFLSNKHIPKQSSNSLEFLNTAIHLKCNLISCWQRDKVIFNSRVSSQRAWRCFMQFPCRKDNYTYAQGQVITRPVSHVSGMYKFYTRQRIAIFQKKYTAPLSSFTNKKIILIHNNHRLFYQFFKSEIKSIKLTRILQNKQKPN